MKNEKEKATETIIFDNEPRLFDHEADKNEEILKLIPHIKSYVASHERFRGKEIHIAFVRKGISSLVCILNTAEEKVVLKISLGIGYTEGETQFLEVWEKVGVRVPRVLERGKIGDHSYILMEFIVEPILSNKYTYEELVENGIYLEMGRTLKRMHIPKADGYGRVIKGKAGFSNFEAWLTREDMKKRIKYVKEHKLLNGKHGSLATAFEILKAHIGVHEQSSYCHGDFAAYNIFATNPLTVFDPSPRFNNEYIDLAQSLVMNIAHGQFPEEFIQGYFNGEPYDDRVLHAAILLTVYSKFRYWHQVEKFDRIQNAQTYLLNNKS